MYAISSFYSRVILNIAQRHGVDKHQLLSNTGLTLSSIEQNSDVDLTGFVKLLENANHAINDERLGLMIAKRVNINVLGAVGATVTAAPTIRDGLRAMASYSSLHAGYVKLELFARHEWLEIQMTYLCALGTTSRFHTESSALQIQHYIESITGETLTQARYSMDFPKPSYANEYRNVLHGDISYDSKFPSVLLPLSILDAPSPYFHAEMWTQGQQQLVARLNELRLNGKTSYTQHVTALLRSSVSPLPTLIDTAKHLHLSPRTLNRKLHKEGSMFRQLKLNVLNERAENYLKHTDWGIESIAASLGYQDASNFRRAFRTQFGKSPSEFREQNRPHLRRVGASDVGKRQVQRGDASQ